MQALQEENATLRAENARLAAELARVKQKANAQLKALHAENVSLKKRLSAGTSSPTSEPGPDLQPLLRLLRDSGANKHGQTSTGKLCADARYFEFGATDEFLGGLAGLLSRDGLSRSIEEECRDNDGGAWAEEYAYVVTRAAEEDVDLPSTRKSKGKLSSSGVQIVRDAGHAGMMLSDFVASQEAVDARLSAAEVAALRLYTGPLFQALNAALRAKDVSAWATTISCCYSGVLKLSRLAKPTLVYRGVNEEHLKLPERFYTAGADGGASFAGGIERAFMSTTKNATVALDYSGGAQTAGSVLAIAFTEAARGASVQWLSQYPHEEELLFPPCTGLSCRSSVVEGHKRVLSVTAQVSTACPNVSDIDTPEHVPGTAAALHWLAQASGHAPEVLPYLDNIDLSNVNCQAFAGHLSLLVGRAAHALPKLRHLKLRKCQLRAGVADLAQGLSDNRTLQSLHLGGNNFGQIQGGAGIAAALSAALRRNETLVSLDLRNNNMDSASCALIAMALADNKNANRTLRELNLSGNFVDTACASSLAAAIDKSPVFCSLRLQQCGLDEAAKALLLKAKRAKAGASHSHKLELVY